MLTGCTGSTTGTPVAASQPASSVTLSTAAATAPSLDLTPPTTAVANPQVTGTSFDGCAAVTKVEEAQWQLRPDSKHDTANNGPLGAESVRGCLWNGKNGQVRVYAFDGTIQRWQKAQQRNFDRMEPTQFGDREGLVAHKAPDQVPGCTVLLPSQSGIAGVMTLPSVALEDQGADMCPFATQIMTTIEPRIP
ncbi:DUF3558 family protein [Mycobacteroides franklinii]|uniref:DUF3558 family protein n=1 Tax=Mycobacteroides franklinii TaxID=948102 RepID=UPI001F297F18|nr:DUF3558 family protein [Mycobacteroides franklinii]